MTENRTKYRAIISPRDKVAGYTYSPSCEVMIITPSSLKGTLLDMDSYISRFPCTSVFDLGISSVNSVEKNVAELLDGEVERSDSFRMFSMIMDEQLNSDNLKDVARLLEKSLVNTANLDYILNIALATPLPNSEVLKQIATLTDEIPRLQNLLLTIVTHSRHIIAADRAWKKLCDSEVEDSKTRDYLHGKYMSKGVFRILVLSDTDGEISKISINTKLIFNKNIQGDKDFSTSRLTRLIDHYIKELPKEIKTSERPEPLSITNHEEEYPNTTYYGPTPNVSIQRNADEMLHIINAQISKIIDEYGRYRDAQADKYLDQLVSMQSEGQKDLSYVVKTLTNISDQCSTIGRNDKCIEVLTRALSFTSGLDSRVYLNAAKNFRLLGKHDEADEFLDRASEYAIREAHQGNIDKVQSERLKILISKGEYTKALSQYEQIDNIKEHPYMWIDKSTLLRKMGNTKGARNEYLEFLKVNPGAHQAFAGLAECNKHHGRTDKAIVKYISILNHIKKEDSEYLFVMNGKERNITERTIKVYNSALSHLYRLNTQYNMSLMVLIDLESKYPSDYQVHSDLSRVYALMNNQDKAVYHFNKSQQLSSVAIGDIAAKLYRYAFQQEFKIDAKPNAMESKQLVSPEEYGLQYCSHTLKSIIQEDYASVQRDIGGIKNTSKIHSDYGNVLLFHALKALDNNYDIRSNQTLCRIKKRGHYELKNAVNAIDDCRFDNAIDHELRMAICIA